MPHPLLELDICECSHKGKVIFPSSHKNFLLVTEAGILTPSDLSKAKIIGCTNPIIKGGPCTKLVSIPESITTNLLEIENEKAVLAECISQVLTNKGSPIFLQGEPKAKGILEIQQDSIQETQQETKQDIQDSNSFYPYHSSYPHLTSKDKNAGVKEIGEEESEYDLSEIQVVGKDIDISLVSEYSRNILRRIARNSGYNKVVISSTARTPRRQAEIMYNNIVENGMQEQRKTYKPFGQKVLDTYETQKKANKNKEETIQAMTNKINELGASNISKHCADFSTQNVVDIPYSSLGKNKEKFKSEAIKLLGRTNVLDENNCYHIVIHQQDLKEK